MPSVFSPGYNLSIQISSAAIIDRSRLVIQSRTHKHSRIGGSGQASLVLCRMFFPKPLFLSSLHVRFIRHLEFFLLPASFNRISLLHTFFSLSDVPKAFNFYLFYDAMPKSSRHNRISLPESRERELTSFCTIVLQDSSKPRSCFSEKVRHFRSARVRAASRLGTEMPDASSRWRSPCILM